MLTNTTIDIIVNNKPITKYEHKGDTFVEGRPRSEYSIKIDNRGDIRKKVVISVDGLSIIDGKPASENSPGYVIEPFSSEVFKGWRTDDNHVSQFVFGDKKRSYSNKSGNGTKNVGVIGVLVFAQKVVIPNYMIRKIQQPFWNTDPVTRAYSSLLVENSVNNIGTEFGDSVNSESTTSNVEFLDCVYETLSIYYDNRRGLESRGIVVDYRKSKPQPFPASTQYCKIV